MLFLKNFFLGNFFLIVVGILGLVIGTYTSLAEIIATFLHWNQLQHYYKSRKHYLILDYNLLFSFAWREENKIELNVIFNIPLAIKK